MGAAAKIVNSVESAAAIDLRDLFDGMADDRVTTGSASGAFARYEHEDFAEGVRAVAERRPGNFAGR